MTYLLFFGCLFVVFGPSLALFLLVVSRNNQLIIFMIGGSFFWLLSILVSSIWWYIVTPLRASYWFVIPFAVLFQEAGRLGCYRLYTWAFRTTPFRPDVQEQVENNPRLKSLTKRPNHVAASLAAGLGYGVTYALVMYTSVLWEATGPGTVFSPSCPTTNLFIISALLALLFSTMHIFLSLLLFDAFRMKDRRAIAIGWGAHLVISFLSTANLPGGQCAGSVVPIALLVTALGGYSVYKILHSDAIRRKD